MLLQPEGAGGHVPVTGETTVLAYGTGAGSDVTK
jgi:hypothetical protein